MYPKLNDMIDIKKESVPNEVVLKFTGFKVTGTAFVTDWVGYNGNIGMKPFTLNEVTDETLLDNINDNGFGVQSIDGAACDIWLLYGNDYKVFHETVTVGRVPDDWEDIHNAEY